MGVRYTAVTSMPQAAPRDFERDPERQRDVERWRDKLELRLDNRQVFFLFFGSAVVACMLFILGVMVGKRIESRGQAEAATPQDPLTALDRAHEPAAGATGAAQEPELSFPSTLIAGALGVGRGGRPLAAKTNKAVALVAAPKPIAPPAAPKVVAAPAPPKVVAAAAPPKIVAAPITAPVPKPAPPAPPTKIVAAVSLPKPASVSGKPVAVAPAASLTKAPAPVSPAKAVAAAPVPRPVGPAADPTKVKGKFTLQLSTFTTADEARAFADRYPGAFVIGSDAAGKGGTFRVRYGNFASYKEATDAKESFEKQHNMIALVAAR
jgi:hypothetical protein